MSGPPARPLAGWLHPPVSAVRDVVARALAEDLGVMGDVTAGLLTEGTRGAGRLVARARGVLAGTLAAEVTFSAVDPGVALTWLATEGDEVGAGQALATVEGPLVSILTAERTSLNLLGHLSGVATLTRRFVDAAGDGPRIRDTRKTTPGLRALEKAAVRAGGGANHRGSLSDGILVKDNHLAGLTIGEAVAAARVRWPGLPCQVECDSLEQVREAVAAGAELVLLDNMDPPRVAEAVGVVGGSATVEVSGGITLETVGDYAKAGAQLISVGALTHSAPALDVALDIEPGR